ncbi:MAG: zinc ribbon domain-containing protein [Candidatus Thermoplasmatota archaeon]|nr:zinc ribbon domain-containing protein [Candidatus Thermoplasmatota archaeon]
MITGIAIARVMPAYCSNCNQQIPDDAVKCPNCGAEFTGEKQGELKSLCSQCQKEIPEDSKSCPHCGISFRETANIAQITERRINWAILAASILFIGMGIWELILCASFVIAERNGPFAGFSHPDPAWLLTIPILQIAIGGIFWWRKSVGALFGIVFCFMAAVFMIFPIIPIYTGSLILIEGKGGLMLWQASLAIRFILMVLGIIIEAKHGDKF